MRRVVRECLSGVGDLFAFGDFAPSISFARHRSDAESLGLDWSTIGRDFEFAMRAKWDTLTPNERTVHTADRSDTRRSAYGRDRHSA